MEFGKTAEAAATYLKKGSNVYLEGRIQTQKYQDKTSGQDRYSTSIICHEMQFIGGGNSQQGLQNPGDQLGGFQPANSPQTPKPDIQRLVFPLRLILTRAD